LTRTIHSRLTGAARAVNWFEGDRCRWQVEGARKLAETR